MNPTLIHIKPSEVGKGLFDRLWELRLTECGRSDMTKLLEDIQRVHDSSDPTALDATTRIVYAQHEELVLGWASAELIYSGKRGHQVFLNTFVAEEFRRRGIGRSLSLAVLEQAQSFHLVVDVYQHEEGFWNGILSAYHARQDHVENLLLPSM